MTNDSVTSALKETKMMLEIYPAIDLLEGRAVRLVKGKRETAETVGVPLALVDQFHAAPMVHVVDLDGAFAGGPRQYDLIRQIAKRHKVQAGGGVRSMADVDALFECGVSRVVVGTKVLVDPSFLDALGARGDRDRVVIAADVKDGFVAGSGWETTSQVTPRDLALRLVERGLTHVLCTAVHRDGTLEGPDVDVLAQVRVPGANVIASGGIGALDDLRAVKHAGCGGVVVGKAIYAGRFTLEQALAVANEG
jgi:phosphoribosylformimino-5-aminoimidazole carboxamide ribotide isomerase